MSKRVLWIIYSGALSFESNFSAFQAVECLYTERINLRVITQIVKRTGILSRGKR